MNLRAGKSPLTWGQAETIALMSDKTGLDKRTISLVIEIFILLIKKVLIEQGRLYIWNFGSFNLKISRKKDTFKRYAVFFSACDDFKEIMKGERKLKLLCRCEKKFFKNYFPSFADMLGISVKDLKYLFNLYTYCISKNLLKYNEFKLLKFGYLKIVDYKGVELSGLSKKFPNKKINTRRVIFKYSITGKRDINRRNRKFPVCQRLKRMMYFSKIDRTIRTKLYWLKDNDTPLATLYRQQ